MIVYRITKKEHAALDGLGGLFGPGRWHKKGHLIIYTSEHASLAAWEKIVHVSSFQNLSDNLLLVKIIIPDEFSIQSVPQSILVNGWNSFPFCSETLNFGTSFLQSRKHLSLRVPSAIIPDEYNIILNPRYPDFQACEIVSEIPFIFDKRVIK